MKPLWVKPPASRTAVASWILYDWAYSAFTTVVSTFVIATYVTRAVAPDPATGASAWGATQAVAGIVIALLSVPLGAVADRAGRGRLLLGIATTVMAAATLGLWTVRPHPAYLLRALLLVGVATVSFEIATVFYNAMLPFLAKGRRLGRLSMLGWGAGYAGGLCCLGLCLLLIGAADRLHLDRGQGVHVRLCAVLAGVWIAVFGWPVAVTAPRIHEGISWRRALREGLRTVRATWRDALRRPDLRRFLLAQALYTDGLTTLFAFGGIYAAARFGLDSRGVLAFGLRIMVAAGIGTFGFALIGERLSPKATVLGSVLAVAALGAAVLMVEQRGLFMVLAASLGLFIGPAQAAGRSMMARLAPAEACCAYFGLFALSGRVTAFAGPAVLSIVTWSTGSLRCGMATIVLFLLAGAVLLSGVHYHVTIPAPRARDAT